MQEVKIKKFKKVLVANRGEIAIRVYRAPVSYTHLFWMVYSTIVEPSINGWIGKKFTNIRKKALITANRALIMIIFIGKKMALMKAGGIIPTIQS